YLHQRTMLGQNGLGTGQSKANSFVFAGEKRSEKFRLYILGNANAIVLYINHQLMVFNITSHSNFTVYLRTNGFNGIINQVKNDAPEFILVQVNPEHIGFKLLF